MIRERSWPFSYKNSWAGNLVPVNDLSYVGLSDRIVLGDFIAYNQCLLSKCMALLDCRCIL